MTYYSLEQRMAQNYVDMLPPFVPDKNASVSILEQECFYDMIKNLYRLAFDEPLLFVASLHEDDAYPNRFHKASYGKPDLLVSMKKFTKSVDGLLQNMFLLGQGCGVKLNKRQQAVLSKIGINDHGNLPAAWVWLSVRDGANPTSFSYCLFDKGYPYTSDIYARLLGENNFRKLENRLLSMGYKRFDIYDVMASDCKLSLTIANPKWGKTPPNGGFEYKIKHTGISVRLDPYVKNPQILGLCIPNGLKLYLDAFSSMDSKNQDFVIKHTKNCDGCRYCVQTDKSCSRPLAYISVSYKQRTYSLCPYFPGYSYSWTSIDDELAEQIINILYFMDEYAPSNMDGIK